MKSNFDRCMNEVFAHEGGYVNDPHDTGGETNMGISKRAYPHEDIKGMTRARAAEIYRRDYWDAVRGDDLPFGLDLCAFDGAVNSGVSRGAKWVQQALGVEADGKIGPATLAAARSTYVPAAIQRAVAFRTSFLKQLPGWAHFGNGWASRMKAVEAEALSMAVPDHGPPVRPDVVPLPAPQSAAAWWVRAIFGIFDVLFKKWRT